MVASQILMRGLWYLGLCDLHEGSSGGNGRSMLYSGPLVENETIVAKERQGNRTDLEDSNIPRNFAGSSKGDVREIVAKELGVSADKIDDCGVMSLETLEDRFSARREYVGGI